MSQEFNFFFSNQLNILYENLKNRLFHTNSTPFARRLIVVYGPTMKSWLTMRMASDPDLGISAGIEIVYLNKVFDQLLYSCEPSNSLTIPSIIEMALAIEQEIVHAVQTFSVLSIENQNIWQPLIHYLKLDPSSPHFLQFSRKIEKRIISLSTCLADCFQDYGRYAGSMLSHWEETTPNHWQQIIWNKLFGSKYHWTYPCKAFRHAIPSESHLEVHFFSISFINRSEFQFLHTLAQTIPISYYLLSPCAVFWSDIRSDRESAFLRTFWHEKLGTNSSQVTQLEELLRDRNPLLANFGRLGREVAYLIDESAISAHAKYILPHDAERVDEELFSNEDMLFFEKNSPLTLLESIQSDILLMRNPQGHSKRIIDEKDISIQIHIASTKLREIEILYSNLLRIIKEYPDIQPKDISVMAPNILEYMPYIQSVFGDKESQLDFQILDIDLRHQNEIARGFLQLIEMADSRWDVTELLQLFEYTGFQRRHHITQTDYALIRQWIEASGILWGHNLEHRNETLKHRHCINGMSEKTESGTWDHGIDRLLIALTTTMKHRHDPQADVSPCEHIDFSQGELLEKWIKLLQSLREDLSLLNDRSRMTLEDWSNYLNCLLESYFQPDFDDSHSIDEFTCIQEKIDVLRRTASSFKTETFSFLSIKAHLNAILNRKSVIFRENRIQTVRFCSMVPLRSIPSEIIALIGMEEGNFPRTGSESMLNLASSLQKDYAPSPVDYDRYLFLEAIQSAQRALLISYQGYSHLDGTELQPSLVVEELLSYLNRHYATSQNNLLEHCIFRHPFDSFDAAYFQTQSPLQHFSLKDYHAALAFYKKQKEPSHTFINQFNFHKQPNENNSNEIIIPLRQLTEVVSDPIKFYLNRSLDMYLKKDDKSFYEEQWTLPPLDKHIMKRLSLKESIENVLCRARQDGKLPLGIFKEVASKKFTDEAEDIHDRLRSHHITDKDIFHIEFCTSCIEPTQNSDQSWIFPAVHVNTSNGQKVKVVGTLPYVTSKGLLAISKASISDAWKIWPQFLLYQHAAKTRQNLFENQLIFVYHSKPKSTFFDDPQPYLSQLISYYSVCQNQLSPLIPEWILLIFEEKHEELHHKMRLLFDGYAFGNVYQHANLQWLLNKNRLPCTQNLIKDWKDQAQQLLGPMVAHWYSKENSQSGDI